MPIALREAETIWEGPLASGTGTLSSASGALEQLPVTWASRTERPDGKTSPEELIAAAHASCFSMALALVLGEMSQENVEIVRAAVDAFNLARDAVEAIDEYWTDDVDFRSVEGAVDDRGPIHGKDALRAYVQDWSDTFEDFRIEPVELIDAGEDKVIAVLRASGQAKLSGVETDLTYAVVYTIPDGKIARGREYWNREEALEAAGLSE